MRQTCVSNVRDKKLLLLKVMVKFSLGKNSEKYMKFFVCVPYVMQRNADVRNGGIL